MSTFNAVQDFYRTVLVKRASEMSSITPDYKVDSAEQANKLLTQGKADQEKQLSSLFANTDRASTADTKALDKALDATGKDSTSTSNPLVKMAMNKAFFEGIRELEFLKVAAGDYLHLVYRSFNDEMNKIANPMFSTKGVGNLMQGMRGVAASAAKKPPPIPAAAMKPKAWGPGSVIQGQSLTGGGVPGAGGSSVNWGKFAQ
jgi:hypothetical protein